MKVYLVGGAIRDEMLGREVSERDWCVAGATPEELVDLGYRPVGKDFPVFLHPKTQEEYALARTERKTSAGYHGFDFYTDPSVTIEQDLQRRDLTVNAMARDEADILIDPYGGAQDVNDRVLRHVSDAFGEDPVRVLRTAKFAARYAYLGFTVAPETLALMQTMVADGEIDALVPDRVWKETEAALGGDNPQVFFEVLRECGALARLFPEIDRLFGIPQPEKWHPEIDTGIHTLMTLQQAAMLSDDVDVRFAALVHDLGKATSDPAKLPTHFGHEKRGVGIIKKVADRLPVPVNTRELALLVAEYHCHAHRAFELKPETILRVLNRADAFRRPERFEKFIIACEADARGRTGLEDRDYPQGDYLRQAAKQAGEIDARKFVQEGMQGKEIGLALDSARVAALAAFKADYAPNQ